MAFVKSTFQRYTFLMVNLKAITGDDLRLDPGVRGLFTKLVKKGLTVTNIADLLDTTRQTVHRWLKRARHVGREYYKDKTREPRRRKVARASVGHPVEVADGGEELDDAGCELVSGSWSALVHVFESFFVVFE